MLCPPLLPLASHSPQTLPPSQRMQTALLAALAALPVHALHIRELSHMPNILTVPELQVPCPDYSKLVELPAGDMFGVQHSFVGVTALCIVSALSHPSLPTPPPTCSYNSMPKTTSIHAAQYDDVLSTASFVCKPVIEGAAPTLTEGKHVRNDVSAVLARPVCALPPLKLGL
jgi:hypothetical protein